MSKKELIIYTDGASRGNPGPGGWAAVVLAGDYALEIAGNKTPATNNQMELAAVEAVLADSGALAWDGSVVLYSDSMYVINGLTKWAKGWERNGWITSTKTPVENKAQWQNLLVLMKEYGKRISIEKVKGHAGDLYNERCDELAVDAALGKNPVLFSGTVAEYKTFLDENGYSEIGTGKMSTSPKKASSSKGEAAYSYVSMVDGVVHADKTWAECEKRVKGKKGAKYKKVFSKAEETDLMQDYTLASLL
ncbi:MAG: RNase [Candidatus Nomurabacteria bacterium]|nr:RNase [Candidatus Nomurabacteria bacterium]